MYLNKTKTVVKSFFRFPVSSKLLKEYSPYLYSFNMADNFEQVEMFGQFGDTDSEPDPSRHVKISAFGEILTPFSSLRRPVRLTVIGDDGKAYNWIVKYGEDLRQDQRIQQVGIFSRFSGTHHF